MDPNVWAQTIRQFSKRGDEAWETASCLPILAALLQETRSQVTWDHGIPAAGSAVTARPGALDAAKFPVLHPNAHQAARWGAEAYAARSFSHTQDTARPDGRAAGGTGRTHTEGRQS